jgi:hypothetical protein
LPIISPGKDLSGVTSKKQDPIAGAEKDIVSDVFPNGTIRIPETVSNRLHTLAEIMKHNTVANTLRDAYFGQNLQRIAVSNPASDVLTSGTCDFKIPL